MHLEPALTASLEVVLVSLKKLGLSLDELLSSQFTDSLYLSECLCPALSHNSHCPHPGYCDTSYQHESPSVWVEDFSPSWKPFTFQPVFCQLEPRLLAVADGDQRSSSILDPRAVSQRSEVVQCVDAGHRINCS